MFFILLLIISGCFAIHAPYQQIVEQSMVKHGPHYYVEVKFPTLCDHRIQDSVWEKLIDEFINNEVDNFLDEIDIFSFTPDTPSRLIINYQTSRVGRYVNVVFFIGHYYAGTARGTHIIKTFVYDIFEHQQIFLTNVLSHPERDLIYLAKITRQKLKKQFEKMKVQQQSMLEKATEPLIENYTNWLRTPLGIELIFSPEQIISHCYGEQRVEILFQELQ